MVLLVLLVIVVVFIISCNIYEKINDAKREKLMKQINDLMRTYPLAFEKYVTVHRINISTANNEKLESIITFRSNYDWSKEELQLQNEKKRQLVREKSYQEIVANYPNGLKKWNSIHSHSSKDEIISYKYKIQDYEKYYLEAQKNDTWLQEQTEFRNQVLSLQKRILPNEGRYYYEIPFQKLNDEGDFVSASFGVWQIFIKSYCKENDLDYSDFEYIKEQSTKIEAIKHRDMSFNKQVYHRLNDFLIELSQTRPISVYLCANNTEWGKECLSYHYFDRSLFAVLPDNIEVIDPSTYSALWDEDLDYEEYPVFENRHIVIIEMQTENNHLKKVCKNIIDKNKQICPLITYISFFKGYDREEMIELINQAQKEKKDAEKEKEKNVINICKEYGVRGLYHMTHVSNLNSILQNGLLSHTKARNDGFMKVDIADNDVNDRRSHPEPIYKRPIHDYAPLYFNPHNPMLYRRKDQQENIVIIEFLPTILLKEGVVFSDGNAAVYTTATYNRTTRFYSDLKDLKKLNWRCIHSDYWNDYVDGKRIKCAEVLVPDVVERKYITRIHYVKENPLLNDVSKIYGIDIEYSPELYF